jgi:hypothetical protein
LFVSRGIWRVQGGVNPEGERSEPEACVGVAEQAEHWTSEAQFSAKGEIEIPPTPSCITINV